MRPVSGFWNRGKIVRSRKILIIIVIACLVCPIIEFVSVRNGSYEGYLEGEYHFCERAYTKGLNSGADVMDLYLKDQRSMSIEEYNKSHYSWDPNDPRDVLMMTPNKEVYAYAPHDGLCTVKYDDNVVEDFPINMLCCKGKEPEFPTDEKLLTKEEYFDRIKTIARSKNSEDRVNLISDRAMLSYRNIETTIFIGVFLELILGGVTYYLYSQSDNYGWILIIMAVVGVIFDIASSVFMMI